MPNHTEAEQAKIEAIRLEIGKLPAELPKPDMSQVTFTTSKGLLKIRVRGTLVSRQRRQGQANNPT